MSAPTSKMHHQRSTSDAKPASVVGGEINALRLEASAILDQKNPEDYASEHLDIVGASTGSYGSPRHALRNLIAHLMNHSATAILNTYTKATEAGLPDEVLLTEEHIIVHTALGNRRTQLLVDGEIASYDKDSFADYRSIMLYAMNHVDDGHLIVDMFVNRDMRTFQEIMDFLPVLKSSGHRALIEGVL